MPTGYKKDGSYSGKVFKKGVTPHNKGKKFSDEIKHKMSIAKKGFHPKTEFKKGMMPWNKGRHDCLKYWLGKKRPELSGKKHPLWKGGRCVSGNGYIFIYTLDHPHANNDGYVFEHRLVMEKHLGRYLKPEERVHHIDKNKQNNNIENLMLFEDESNHQKFEYLSKAVFYSEKSESR